MALASGFLRRDAVEVRLVEKGFLHAKCYLIYGDKPSGQMFLFDRFQPLIGIVISSNSTGPGLTSHRCMEGPCQGVR